MAWFRRTVHLLRSRFKSICFGCIPANFLHKSLAKQWQKHSSFSKWSICFTVLEPYAQRLTTISSRQIRERWGTKSIAGHHVRHLQSSLVEGRSSITKPNSICRKTKSTVSWSALMDDIPDAAISRVFLMASKLHKLTKCPPTFWACILYANSWEVEY